MWQGSDSEQGLQCPETHNTKFVLLFLAPLLL